MPDSHTILRYLELLARQPSWRLHDRPPEITEDVLRVMDEHGWIEFRLWERAEPNPRPFKDPAPETMVVRPDDHIGWFSPRRERGTAGNLSAVLATGADDPELSPEIRVTEGGKAALADRRVGQEKPPPLTDPQRAALNIIDSVPPGKGITGPEILPQLKQAGHETIQGTLTSHIIPVLKRWYGVKNRHGVGYYREKDEHTGTP